MMRSRWISIVITIIAMLICGFAVADDATKPETAKTADLPSFTYPDVPKYYPSADAKDRIELLAEAKDEQEVVAWADKWKMSRIVSDARSSMHVYSRYRGKRIVIIYKRRRATELGAYFASSGDNSLSDDEILPLVVRYVGPVEDIWKINPKATEMPIFSSKVYNARGGTQCDGYHYPNLPSSFGGDAYVKDKMPLLQAKSRLQIVEWAKENTSQDFFQLEEPFDKLFVLTTSFTSGVYSLSAFIYGYTGKGDQPWQLLYFGDAIRNISYQGNPDLIYVDKPSKNLVFATKDHLILGKINIEHELKMIYGDQYEAVMK